MFIVMNIVLYIFNKLLLLVYIYINIKVLMGAL